MASVAEITKYVEREAQTVDIVHSHVNDNTCLRISDQRFSTNRRETPAYVKLLAISNTYGYMVAGTPTGLSVFMTADAEAELAKGESRGTNTAVSLSARKEIDLSRFGKPTHVGISADELQVLVATITGKLLVFSADSLLHSDADAAPSRSINVGEEVRDMRVNPQDLPTVAAVLTLDGDVLIADFTNGSLKKIVSSGGTPITSICWSRKGKQIVCGDTSATLTQRLPTDGTIKRTIKAQVDDGNIEDGSAILAVDWIDTYTFFAVYGLVPDGTFTPGNGGGGDGSNDKDDGFDQNMTSAYVITQASKQAPMQWLCVEDPCSSMMCPTRYPGFHIASISDWGTSAQNILIMAGTSSDATMTIGQAATSDLAARDVDSSPELKWAMWDIDGAMAVMPLSAIGTDYNDSADTYPIGMAVDYTCKRDLPPVIDDGDRVMPVPVLWVLNTDACLLGYHVYNTYEMKRNTRCSLMVDQVKPLPGAPGSESTPQPAAVEPPKTAPFGSAKAFGGAFGSATGSVSTGSFGMLAKSTSSTPGLFGAPSAVPAFGMSSANAPVAKPLTTFGVTGQHVFGSASKSSATTTTAFGGFGGTALSAGKSIFDAPSGSSIFDANDKAKTASPFGSTSTTSLSGPSKSTTTQPFLAPSGFGVSQAKDIGVKPSDNTPAPVSFGSAPKSTFGLSTGNLTSSLFDSVKKPSPSFAPASTSKPADKERLEDEKRKEDERRKEDDRRKEVARAQEAARVLELERRNEQARLDALQRELEEKSQELIDQQYIATCNSFDRDLKALVSSVKETESAIACVRSASLPPIPLNTTVQSKAAITDASKPLTIDDTESWGRIADVLLEALHVSHDELRASQKSVTKQLSGYIKTETKREEISRILDSAASTMSLPNATVDGGLNPLQRDYQRRLKSAFALIGKRSADVEQVVLAEASRVESKVNDLLPLLRAPTFDTVQRTLLNVTKAVRQKNLELDELARFVDDMAIDEPVERSRHRERKAALPTVPATSVLARRSSRTRSTGGTDTGALRTAATGIPWSPDALPLNTPSFGRRVGGFGLSYEDLVVHDKPTDMAPVAPQQSFGHPRRSIFSNLPSKTDAVGTNPNFPHTQVRELVPRSSKVNRKASLVLDNELAAPGQESGDGASLAPTSAFSGTAAYIQARKQRSLVRDALTHSNRTAALIQSPDSTATRAYKLGSLSSSIVAEPVPMPNLERYVQAFGKLKLVEPAPSPAPEPEVQQILPAPAFGSAVALAGKTSPLGLKAKEWQCSMCDLMSPDSAVTCVVCEHPKPGTQPAPSASLAIVNKPPPATFSGFKPSGGLSLIGLAAVLGQPPSSTSASLGTPMLSFSSFVPPTGATAALAANPTPAPSGFKPSGGLSLTQPSAPSASSVLPFGTASSQVPSFGAFVPPGGMAPLASVAGGTGLPTFPVAAQKDMPVPATGNDDKWICDVCELKSPSHATACVVCETPRPSASAAAPATDANVSDSDESEYSGAEDGSGNSEDEDEDEGEYSDGSVDAVESNLVSDEASERELGDTEADVEVNTGNSHDVDADSGNAINAGEMTDANSVSHPVLSYADAAKVALADHSGEEPASGETTVSTPDRLDYIGETPAETGNDEAPTIDLEPTTPDSARSDEHDHDSDGFVHVSQLESGLQSKADVSQADDDDDGALSIVASEASLDIPADISPSTGEHVSDMASDIGDTAQDQGDTSDTESKILAALSDELDRGIPDGHTPVSEDQQQAIESELSTQNSSFDAHLAQFLSGASVTLVVDHALGCHLGVPEPAVAVEEIDATGTSAANDDDAIAPELVKVDDDVSEEAHALQPDVESQYGDSDVTPDLVTGADSTPPLQAPVEQQDEPAPAFALDGLAAGIDSVLGDAADAADESDVVPECAIEQVPTGNVAAAPAQLPAANESDTKSVFKAGRLGSFGGQLGKSTTSNLAASLSSSTTALPNAFSAVATTSTLEFGAKLDRPAFGVASMSLSGRQQPAAAMPSGSFASMGKIGAGFSSRASPSIDPFAAFKGTSNFLGALPAADTTTASSGKSSPQPILDSNSAHTPGGVSLSRQTIKTSTKPTVRQHGIKAVDPILSIIHGSDSEADKDDLDSNYDSE